MTSLFRKVAVIAAVALALVAVAVPGSAAGPTPAAVVEGFPLMPYTADGGPAPGAGFEGGAYLVKVTDAAGKFVGVARWDGKAVTVRKDQAGWTIPLIAWTGSIWLHLELGVSVGPHSVVSLEAVSDPLTARNYRYTLAFAGSGAWAAAGDEATPPAAAVRSSVTGSKGDLTGFLALSTDYQGVSFIAKIHKAAGKPDMHYVEMTAARAKDAPTSSRLMMARAAGVECWSHEPVLAAATTISSTATKPDVRVFATVDKQAARPGDTLTYTYYLFNAGAQAPAELSAAFDIPAGSVFVAGSVSGDPASVTFKTAANGAVESISWAPKNDLQFGQVSQVSFSVIVK